MATEAQQAAQPAPIRQVTLSPKSKIVLIFSHFQQDCPYLFDDLRSLLELEIEDCRDIESLPAQLSGSLKKLKKRTKKWKTIDEDLYPLEDYEGSAL
uniref:Uncharacterized protein n=1 Tax=Oryza sativa subsp. indica TaxID=39946 RepID=A0A679BBL3_ORYSI|nr:hypothetical protein [Oryza sativa Indica Group]